MRVDIIRGHHSEPLGFNISLVLESLASLFFLFFIEVFFLAIVLWNQIFFSRQEGICRETYLLFCDRVDLFLEELAIRKFLDSFCSLKDDQSVV